jgi:putative restriction endonuclease
LVELLREFGPARTHYQAELPFWYLQSDGIWTVSDIDRLEMRKGKQAPKPSSMSAVSPNGALTADVESALARDPKLLADTVKLLLDGHFPNSLHQEILDEIGFETVTRETSLKMRDPAFRGRVLRAYERRCAVCGFDVHLGVNSVALDAAHIKWHQAGGPDREANGLALCALHHRLFDRGAFTLSHDRRIVVSQDVSGSDGLEEALLRYHGCGIREPQSASYCAGREFIFWHHREVFRGPGRE